MGVPHARSSAAISGGGSAARRGASGARGGSWRAGASRRRSSGSGALGFVRLASGYSFKSLRKDIAATNKGNMKALKHAIKHTTFFGGAGNLGGGVSGTVVLPRAGKYIVFNFGGNLPKAGPTLPAYQTWDVGVMGAIRVRPQIRPGGGAGRLPADESSRRRGRGLGVGAAAMEKRFSGA